MILVLWDKKDIHWSQNIAAYMGIDLTLSMTVFFIIKCKTKSKYKTPVRNWFFIVIWSNKTISE